MPEQLVLPFIAEMDRQDGERAEAERQRMKRANAIAHLRANVQQHPMTDYERRVVPKGVRLARFLIDWECEQCPYACEDHSLGNKFGIDYTNQWGPSIPCVCLKDYYKKGYGDDHG